MSPPTPLAIATSAATRLLHERKTYVRELDSQQLRISQLEGANTTANNNNAANNDDNDNDDDVKGASVEIEDEMDGNREWVLAQEVGSFFFFFFLSFFPFAFFSFAFFFFFFLFFFFFFWVLSLSRSLSFLLLFKKKKTAFVIFVNALFSPFFLLLGKKGAGKADDRQRLKGVINLFFNVTEEFSVFFGEGGERSKKKKPKILLS